MALKPTPYYAEEVNNPDDIPKGAIPIQVFGAGAGGGGTGPNGSRELPDSPRWVPGVNLLSSTVVNDRKIGLTIFLRESKALDPAFQQGVCRRQKSLLVQGN